MSRREFTKAVKVEIIKRATRDGVVYCEQCGLPAKRFDIDHTKADALEIDKTRKLTAADGQLLCAGKRATCHGAKTAEQDIPNVARAKRREAAHIGAKTAPAKPIQSPGFTPAPKQLKASKPIDKLAALPRRSMFR